MKQITQENINQLDISLGGGITSEKVRIDTINHPILVVGLGGTGTDALLRLKYQINRRFKLPDNPITKQKKSKPDNIEYLSFETNEHDKKRYKGISLDHHTETVLLSNAGIGSILNNRSTLPDYIKDWLSPELTITDGTKGASGNRQAGRLLLFEKINTAIDAIDNKIRSLRGDQENKLLVFLLSGLSGGTGGGMFMDIAYIIRGLMERDYGAKGVDKVEIMGYLFTPDVHMAGNSLNIHTEEYIQRNGYAALKELDYWMNLEERGERFCQKYGTRLDVNSALAPFNLCHLVSASNIDGMFIKGAYDYCMNVTAENIVNFLAMEEKESGQEFALQDYHSNLLSNIGTMKSNLPPGMPQAANFAYNIIGASAAMLPTEGINAYLAYGLFRELAPMFNAAPDDYGLNQFVQATDLDIPVLGAELTRQLPPIKLDYAETDYYSYQNVIKTRRVNIDEKLTDQYSTAKRAISTARTLTAKTIETIKSELKSTFIEHGPTYTSRLINSDRGPCLLARLDACQQHLREKMTQANEEISALELSATTRLEEAQKAIFLSKESKKNAYIEAKIKVYQAHIARDCFAALIDIYKEIRVALEAENDKFYAVYVEILREVNTVLSNNAAILVESSIDSPNQKDYHWDIVNIAGIVPEIDRILKEVASETLARGFAKSLLEESERFLNDNRLDVVGAISDFIYDQFGTLLSRSMSDFLKLKYSSDRIIEHIIEAEIAPRLFRDAKPVFNLDNAAGMFNFPSYGMVSVPWNAPDILRGIEAYQQHTLSNLRFNIRKSNITDRIFWLNTQNGIPLFAFAPIKVYEELYERTIATKEGVGRHLVMTENENWRNLPSPIPESLWGDTYNNSRQKVLNDEARQLFQQGLRHGSIKQQGGHYVCTKTEAFDPTRYSFDVKSDINTLYTLLAELSRLKESGIPQAQDPIPTGSEEEFIRNPRLITLVKVENAKYAALESLLQQLQTLLVENDKEKATVDDFMKALVFEAIVKRGTHFIYEKELEEDPWPSFVNLIDQADYPEFAMFQTYKNLSPGQQETLKKKSTHETWTDDRILLNLKKWQGKIAIRKNQLDQDMHKWPNGAEMYVFYRNVLLRLTTQVSALE